MSFLAKNTEGGIVTRLAVMLVFGLFWLWGAVIFYTPFFVKDFIAELKARIWFYAMPFKKRILLINLVHVFPRRAEESMDEFKVRIEGLALRNMHHMILCVMELFERFHWSDDVVASKVLVNGNEVFQKQLATKKGFFILTAHLGNWELITRVGAYLKIAPCIITKRLRNKFFNQIWVQSRTRYGLGLLEEEGSGLNVLRAVQKGANIGFILDQHTGEPHGIRATFFGIEAWCPKGLAILASRLEAPVIPAFIKRRPDGRHEARVLPAIDFSRLEAPEFRDPKSHKLNEAGIRAHVEICNRLIEKFILETPEQYLWIHKRFKQTFSYTDKLPWEL